MTTGEGDDFQTNKSNTRKKRQECVSKLRFVERVRLSTTRIAFSQKNNNNNSNEEKLQI